MVKRTEEDKAAQAPILVTLGGVQHEIKQLVIRDSRVWRKKIIGLIAPLPKLVNVTMDDAEGFEDVLNQMMVTMPDQVIDLFFFLQLAIRPIMLDSQPAINLNRIRTVIVMMIQHSDKSPNTNNNQRVSQCTVRFVTER